MSDEAFISQAKPTVPAVLPDNDKPIQQKVYMDNSPDYKLARQTHTPIAPGAGVIYQIYEYANKQTGEPKTVDIHPADAPKLAQVEAKIKEQSQNLEGQVKAITPLVVKQGRSSVIPAGPKAAEPSLSEKVKNVVSLAIQELKKNPVTAFELGKNEGIIKTFTTNDYSHPEAHPYANTSFGEKLALSRAADKANFAVAQFVKNDKTQALDIFKSLIGEKPGAASILTKAYESYLNAQGFVTETVVNAGTDVLRFGSEMPMIWQAGKNAVSALAQGDYEACGKYSGEALVRFGREGFRAFAIYSAAKTVIKSATELAVASKGITTVPSEAARSFEVQKLPEFRGKSVTQIRKSLHENGRTNNGRGAQPGVEIWTNPADRSIVRIDKYGNPTGMEEALGNVPHVHRQAFDAPTADSFDDFGKLVARNDPGYFERTHINTNYDQYPNFGKANSKYNENFNANHRWNPQTREYEEVAR